MGDGKDTSQPSVHSKKAFTNIIKVKDLNEETGDDLGLTDAPGRSLRAENFLHGSQRGAAAEDVREKLPVTSHFAGRSHGKGTKWAKPGTRLTASRKWGLSPAQRRAQVSQ